MASSSKDRSSEPRDLISRGVYKSNPVGTATFIGLRILDPFLQYQILAHGIGSSILAKLGLSTLPSPGQSAISSLPLPRKILLAMDAGSVIKQIFWLLCISKEELTPSSAVSVGLYNLVINSLNSIFYITGATSASLSGPSVPIPGTQHTVTLPIALGVVLYVVGMAVETISEIQRKTFKDDPANKGKICNTGLWSVVRHPNYFGYELWRTGFALAGGGWPLGACIAAWHAFNFVKSSIVSLDAYMGKRYDEQWKKYKKDVPYRFFPGIF